MSDEGFIGWITYIDGYNEILAGTVDVMLNNLEENRRLEEMTNVIPPTHDAPLHYFLELSFALCLTKNES